MTKIEAIPEITRYPDDISQEEADQFAKYISSQEFEITIDAFDKSLLCNFLESFFEIDIERSIVRFEDAEEIYYHLHPKVFKEERFGFMDSPVIMGYTKSYDNKEEFYGLTENGYRMLQKMTKKYPICRVYLCRDKENKEES